MTNTEKQTRTAIIARHGRCWVPAFMNSRDWREWGEANVKATLNRPRKATGGPSVA